MENVDIAISSLMERQEHLYEVQSFSMSALTAMRIVLQKNGVISIKEFEDTLTSLMKKSKDFKEDNMQENILHSIDSESMPMA